MSVPMDSDPDAQSIGSNGSNISLSDGNASVAGLSSSVHQDSTSGAVAYPSSPSSPARSSVKSSSRHSVPDRSHSLSGHPPSPIEGSLQLEYFTGPVDDNEELETSSPTRSPTKSSSRRSVPNDSRSLQKENPTGPVDGNEESKSSPARSPTKSPSRHSVSNSSGFLSEPFEDFTGSVKAPSDIPYLRGSTISDASGFIRHDRRMATPPARRRRHDVALTRLSRAPPSPRSSERSSAAPSVDEALYEYHDRQSLGSSTPSRSYAARHTKTRARHAHSKSPANASGSFTSYNTTSRPFSSLNPYAASIAYSLVQGSDAAQYVHHTQSKKPNSFAYVRAFLMDTIPRQVYVHLMLRLPTLYFLRVARIFDEAGMSLLEIMPLSSNRDAMSILGTKEPSSRTSHFWNLKIAWQAFIDTLLKEWKTLNIVSVLLLSAILTMLQLPGAVSDPLILYSALASLLCSLTSLLYGCIYIIRFSSMRKTYRAIAWVRAVQKAKTSIWWNVWVLLAMPAVWLAWSILLFMLCIMTYVWNVDPTQPVNRPGKSHPVVPRAILSALLTLAFVYSVLIAITFNQYGEKVDNEWRKSVTDMRTSSFLNSSDISLEQSSLHLPDKSPPRSSPSENENDTPRAHANYAVIVPSTGKGDLIPPLPSVESASIASETLQLSSATPEVPPQRVGKPIVPRSVSRHKVVGLWFHNHDIFPVPANSEQRGLRKDEWEQFVSETCLAWDGDNGTLQDKYNLQTPLIRKTPQDDVAQVLAIWNERLTSQHSLQAVLCKEYVEEDPNSPQGPDSPSWAIYMLDFSPDESGNIPRLAERFGSVPKGSEKVVIFDPWTPFIPFKAISTATTTIARRELDSHVRFRRKSDASE